MNIINEIENRFTYHPPKDKEQVEKYAEIRAAARDFAIMLCEVVPGSRERSLALTKLEECVMWSNAGIARDTGEPKAGTEITEVVDLELVMSSTEQRERLG